MTKKEHRASQLAAALYQEEIKTSLDPNDMVVEASYSGPKLGTIDDVTPEWVVQLMEWQRDRKILHKKFAVMIINKATEYFGAAESLVDVPLDDLEEITVCGDIHG